MGSGAVAAAEAGDGLGVRLPAGGPVAAGKVEGKLSGAGAAVGAPQMDDTLAVLVEADGLEGRVGRVLDTRRDERRLARRADLVEGLGGGDVGRDLRAVGQSSRVGASGRVVLSERV